MTVLMKLYYSRADSCSTVLEKCKKSEINSGNRAQVLGPTKLGFSKKPGVSDQTLSMSRLLRFARKKPSVFDLPGLLHLYSFRRNLSFFKFDDSLVTFWKELLSFSLYTVQRLLFLGCLMLFFIVIFRTRAGMCYR